MGCDYNIHLKLKGISFSQLGIQEVLALDLSPLKYKKNPSVPQFLSDPFTKTNDLIK